LVLLLGCSRQCCFLLMIPLPPTSTLFPYTTLFRSGRSGAGQRGPQGVGRSLSPAARRREQPGCRAGPPSSAARVLYGPWWRRMGDRKSTRLNSSHVKISYAVFCLKKKSTNFTTTEN